MLCFTSRLTSWTQSSTACLWAQTCTCKTILTCVQTIANPAWPAHLCPPTHDLFVFTPFHTSFTPLCHVFILLHASILPCHDLATHAQSAYSHDIHSGFSAIVVPGTLQPVFCTHMCTHASTHTRAQLSSMDIDCCDVSLIFSSYSWQPSNISLLYLFALHRSFPQLIRFIAPCASF